MFFLPSIIFVVVVVVAVAVPTVFDIYFCVTSFVVVADFVVADFVVVGSSGYNWCRRYCSADGR